VDAGPTAPMAVAQAPMPKGIVERLSHRTALRPLRPVATATSRFTARQSVTSGKPRTPCDEPTRKAGYGKSVRPV